MSEGSFTGYLSIRGYSLECVLGFEYLERKTLGDSGMWGGGINAPSSTVSVPLKTEYLCASTAISSFGVNAKPKGSLFHFQPTNNVGEYIITSRDKLNFPGLYLGITNTYYIKAYSDRSESNAFKFRRGDKFLTLDDMPDSVINGIRLDNKHGGIDLHNRQYSNNSEHLWAAYVCTKYGDCGTVGYDLILTIIERNVD